MTPPRGKWRADQAPRLELAAHLDEIGVPADARLMTIDAAGFKYLTGRGGVVSPDDPIDTIRAVAEAYDIDWLVLERTCVVEALKPVLESDQRPDWIGTPSLTIFGREDEGPPDLVLYPICIDRLDGPCSEAGG